MAPGQSAQLEKVIEEVLKSGDVQALDVFLQRDANEGTSLKCSGQFLNKLDKLVSRSLDQKNSKIASSCFGLLCKCGKNLKLPGGCQGLSGLIAQGLIKMWFEKCRQLWILCGPQWNETLFNLSEDFFDALRVVHEAGKDGTYQITESFLYPVGQLAVDPRIYILIQKEAIRKFNLILDKIPAEMKKQRKILPSQEASDVLVKIAGQILEGGDYDYQTALMEALCRMASPEQRKELSDRWFSMEHVARAFIKISDSEFEMDCRKFLNLVNGMHGDKRRVYSYPCLEAYLDKYELLMPSDDKLEEFWIDFNLSSHSISFYFSLADEDAQEGQWETICINENEVQSYTLKEKGKRKVLQLKLSEVVVVGAVEGSSLAIQFSSSLDILQAAQSVFGHSKNDGFVKKTGTSVGKTTVKIIMEENSSQVVPESQVSLGESGKNTVPYLLPTPSAPVQILTPARMRISESATFISGCSGGNVRGASSLSAVMPSNTPVRGKGKPSLEMVHTSGRQGDLKLGELRTSAKTGGHGTTPSSLLAGGMKEQGKTSKQTDKENVDQHQKNMDTKAADMVVAGQAEEHSLEPAFVPDTQQIPGSKISSHWKKLSVSEILIMPTQKINYLPRAEPSSSEHQKEHLSSAQRMSDPVHSLINQKKLHSELTQRLQQVLNERNQDQAHQESAAPQRKMSDTREDLKGRSSADQSASKEQSVKRIGAAEQKKKRQKSLEKDAAAIKAPAKASTSKVLQEKIPLSAQAETNKALLKKERRDAAVAGSMVKFISSHYENKTVQHKSKAKDSAGAVPQSSIPPPFLNRPVFSRGWLSVATRKETGAFTKSFSKTPKSITEQREDIYAFSTDEPLNIGGKDKTFSSTSAISSSINNSSTLFKTTNKEQQVAKVKRHVKKHLFSDTDTDYAMTEVSWLRESNRKPKPQVMKYPRQANVKPKAVSPHASYESPNSPSPVQKPVKDNANPTKKKPAIKERVEQPKKTLKPAAAPRRPQAAVRRPKRAAATSAKSYRVPDTDDSYSESEEPPAAKAKDSPQRKSAGWGNKACPEVPVMKKRRETSGKLTDASKRPEGNKQSHRQKLSGLKKQRPEMVFSETSKLNKKTVALVEEQMSLLKDSWAARQTSFCLSPPFPEGMRSAERSAPTLGLTCSPLLTPRGSPLPASPDPPCLDTPSPILLLPKPRSTVSSKGNLKHSSIYSLEKKPSSKTASIRSIGSVPLLTPRGQTPAPGYPIGPRGNEIRRIQQQHPPSLPQSPLLPSPQPLLTSTLLEQDKPAMPSPSQSPFPEDTVNHGCHFSLSKVSSVSLSQSSTKSSTKSSVYIRRIKSSPTSAFAVSYKKEKTPSSERALQSVELHVSGPSRKRHISFSSNSDEDEEEEEEEEEEPIKSKRRGQLSPRMKPRKLFKSYTEISVESELSQVMTPSHTMSSSHGDAETVDGDVDLEEDLELPKTSDNPSNLCQQFSTKLKKKFETRQNMVEVYNRQSLKTVQQHISSLNTQVTKSRTERLEQIQTALMEEIHSLEQEETLLKTMEKDLTIYWKKQITSFCSFHERDTRRNETLAQALQTNVRPSLEYEERIFTTQMCLIRKDMKSVQDRLLSQMQEGEIQSVKRGLHALFFP